MIETERGYKFETTGREFYANIFIGIDSDLRIAEGYDGPIQINNDNYEVETEPLSKAERTEMADYMIDLWTKFKTIDV